MTCTKCQEKAIWLQPKLCKKHYCVYFEEKVKNTIERYSLLSKDTKVCVAVSGGKDSLTILHILHTFNYAVSALAIDEGIANYREHTLVDAQKFCQERNIPLVIQSFEALTGNKLDTMLTNKPELRACTVCGTFRRHLLNKYAHGFDVLATGHNADDEAQAILMNVLRAQTSFLTRPGPATRKTKGLVQRIKPLYFCTEKEIMTYAYLRGFAGNFTECPNVKTSYRARVRDVLNAYEAKYPGAKQRVLTHYLVLQKNAHIPEIQLSNCTQCGAVSNDSVCSSCKMLVTIKT